MNSFNTFINCSKEMRSELEEKQEVMQSLQETGDRLCHENHPAKQTVEVRLPSSRKNRGFRILVSWNEVTF